MRAPDAHRAPASPEPALTGRCAFTLIELLVVITIIVVLLSLLTPALDRAIEQAELAVCAANQKGIATGASTYAMGFSRSYPHRKGVHNPGSVGLNVGARPDALSFGSSFALLVPFDDRPTIRDYIDWKSMLCPLTEEVRLGVEDSDPDASVMSTFSLWYGWRFAGQAGMLKLGQKFAWGGERFDLISGDTDMMALGQWVLGTHPDKNGLMHQEVLQNEAGKDFKITGNSASDGKWTLSRWVFIGGHGRGTIDMNFSRADGSVSRLTDVRTPAPELDERVTIVPYESTNRDFSTVRIQLPAP